MGPQVQASINATAVTTTSGDELGDISDAQFSAAVNDQNEKVSGHVIQDVRAQMAAYVADRIEKGESGSADMLGELKGMAIDAAVKEGGNAGDIAELVDYSYRGETTTAAAEVEQDQQDQNMQEEKMAEEIALAEAIEEQKAQAEEQKEPISVLDAIKDEVALAQQEELTHEDQMDNSIEMGLENAVAEASELEQDPELLLQRDDQYAPRDKGTVAVASADLDLSDELSAYYQELEERMELEERIT